MSLIPAQPLKCEVFTSLAPLQVVALWGAVPTDCKRAKAVSAWFPSLLRAASPQRSAQRLGTKGNTTPHKHTSLGHKNRVQNSVSKTSVLYSKVAGHLGTLNNHRSLRYELRRLTRFMTCGRSVTMGKLILIPVLPFFPALCSISLPAHTQNGKIKRGGNSRWQRMEIQNKICHLPTLPKQQVFNHLASQNIWNICAYIYIYGVRFPELTHFLTAGLYCLTSLPHFPHLPASGNYHSTLSFYKFSFFRVNMYGQNTIICAYIIYVKLSYSHNIYTYNTV